MNKGWIYREQITLKEAKRTILDYYSQRYRHSSRTQWQQRITAQQVLLDGYPTTVDTILQPGQWLTYYRPPWEEPKVPLSFEVVYEDSEILVVAKPSGLPVLPGGNFLENTLLGQLKKYYPHETPIPIHRLGRGTSGLILLGRSPISRSHLTKQMRQGKINKIYRALVGKSNLPDRFFIDQPIGKIPYPILDYIYAATPNGLASHSDCIVLKRTAKTTLLKVTILTGRPHQIRIHLASVGYPLMGDPLYRVGGIPKSYQEKENEKLPVPGDCGYHLHAYRLSFNHPFTHQPIEVVCPPPVQLQ